jgi:tetratricopeptide (TPR) repeat protein
MLSDTAKEKAEQLHQEAMALDDAGNTNLALKKYLEALQLDFSRPTTHYNIGLIYKYRKQWPESFRYNKRAAELEPNDEAANWNLAIAATALRDWKTARAVWHHLGMPITESSDPIEADFGITPVRLNPEDDGEVVWGRRVDPVRVRILNIPFSKSGFRHGDIVLHDGAPVGYREYEGREYSVFNVLELFEPSAYCTYEAELSVAQPEDIEALCAICDELAVACEDWTTSVRTICRQCSEGHPHQHHDSDLEELREDRHSVGLASSDKAIVQQALEQWQNETRKVEYLELTLGPRLP